MWCVYRGKVCIMVYDTVKRRYVYIREKTWDAMSTEKKERYV